MRGFKFSNKKKVKNLSESPPTDVWLLTAYGKVSPNINYVWMDNKVWDDSKIWTENIIQYG